MKRLKDIGKIAFAITFLVAIPAFITFSPFYIAVYMRDFMYLFLFLITWLPAILTIDISEDIIKRYF